MDRAWIYILQSADSQKTYTGSTSDLYRRLYEHNSGQSRYTKDFAPWHIIYAEEFTSVTDARKREKYLKSAAGRRFLKKMNIYD